MEQIALTIGITGGSSAGKTTVANRLAKLLEKHNPVILPVDQYFHDRSNLLPDERAKLNYDEPQALNFETFATDLENLRDGASATPPFYDYANHASKPGKVTLGPANLIIAEGILLFTPTDIPPLLDIKIFVEAEREERLRRRIARDTRERGRDKESVIRQFRATVEPGYDKYIAPTKEDADIILDWNLYNDEALGQIAVKIDKLMNKSAE